jgi:multiple sugar transport system substrate-binding protein
MGNSDSTRRRFLAATGAGATIGLAGCTDALFGGGGGGNGSTITYLSDRGGSSEIIDEIIAEFESNHDYTVDVTYTSTGTSTDEELQRMIAAGNPPDVVFDTSADAYRYQRDGNLAPVSDAVQGTGLPDPVNVDGESYMAPAMIEPLMFWYRTDLYDGNPETWQGWMDEAARVTEEEGINGFCVQSGQTNNADTQHTQYLWQNGVDIYSGPSDDIQVEIDSGQNRERAIETFEWVQQMNEHSPNGSGWEWGDGIEALQQENVAALASVGGFPVISISENRPDLAENLAAVPFPLPGDREQEKWWAYFEGHVVRSDGDTTEGGQEFVEFFSNSDQFMEFLLTQPLFQLPPTQEGLTNEQYRSNDLVQQFPEVLDLTEQYWDSFTTILATGDDGAPNLTGSDAYSNQVFGRAADELLIGGLSPEETVDFVAEELRSLQE